jgi:hypothetical protein
LKNFSRYLIFGAGDICSQQVGFGKEILNKLCQAGNPNMNINLFDKFSIDSRKKITERIDYLRKAAFYANHKYSGKKCVHNEY